MGLYPAVTRKTLIVAITAAHLLGVATVCSIETYSRIAQKSSKRGNVRNSVAPLLLSPRPNTAACGSELLSTVGRTYAHLAGIEAGYGFFAPNVPPAYRLVFELSDDSGGVKRAVLAPEPGEAGLRVASFLDVLGRTASGDVRHVMFALLGGSLLDQHADANRVAITVEAILLPTMKQWQSGDEPRYEVAYSYEIDRDEPIDGAVR